MEQAARTSWSQGGVPSLLFPGWRTVVMGACGGHRHRLVLMHSGTATHAGCARTALPGFALAPMRKPLDGPGGGNGWRCKEHDVRTAMAQEAAAACLDAGADACEVFARDTYGRTILCTAHTEGGRSRASANMGGAGWLVGCRRAGTACARAAPSMGGSEARVEEWGPLVRGGAQNAPAEPSVEELDAELTGATGWLGASVAARMIRQRGHAICARAQVLLRAVTGSDTYAELMCAAEPLCTVWTRQSATGTTWLCQGYMDIHNSPQDVSFAVGFKRGCEWYQGTGAEDDSRLSRAPRCLATQQPQASSLKALRSCPSPSVAIPVFTKGVRALPPRAVCDECESGGICPRLESTGGSEEAERMRLAMLNVARQQLARLGNLAPKAKELGAAFNPSMAMHRGEMYIAVRQTTAARCSGKTIDGTYELDDHHLGLYVSKIGICPTYGDTVVPRQLECVQIDPMLPYPKLDGMVIDDGGYVGEEDACLFSFRDTLYVLFNIGVRMTTASDDQRTLFAGQIRVRRTLLAVVDPRTGKTEKATLVRVPGVQATENLKNVMPLVKPSEVLLVHSIWPFSVCSLDVATGACEPQRAAPSAAPRSDLDAYRAVGSLSGGTQFVAVPAGYIGMIHRKQDMELGRLYTHKWALISMERPHALVWLSAPFRLPAAHATRERGQHYTQCDEKKGCTDLDDDIQFASGLTVNLTSKTALVSYGVADCYSWVARVALPPEAMRAGASTSDKSLALVTRVPAALPDNARRTPVVRWDSPLTDMSGFAFVTRAMAERFVADETLQTQLWNRHDGSAPFYPERYAKLYAAAVRSQADLIPQPDVTVRMYWEPNLQPAPAGKLVVYLPWEFGPIPAVWVDSLNAVADEVWVPSEAVRDGLTKSGIHPRKLALVPHGVSTEVCTDPIVDAAVKSKRRRFEADAEGASTGAAPFTFFYHGGMLFRKGVPQMLEAYNAAFKGSDNVELVVHSVYGDPPVIDVVAKHTKAAMADRNLPRLKWDRRRLSPTEMSEMYLHADVLVHSSLSEGLGLGVIEAMAHGLPVIASDYGPPADFVTRDNGFLFPANESPCSSYPCSKDSRMVFSQDWTTTSDLVWGNYSSKALARAMRSAYDSRASLPERGMRARREICTEYSWDRAYSIARERLLALASRA